MLWAKSCALFWREEPKESAGRGEFLGFFSKISCMDSTVRGVRKKVEWLNMEHVTEKSIDHRWRSPGQPAATRGCSQVAEHASYAGRSFTKMLGYVPSFWFEMPWSLSFPPEPPSQGMSATRGGAVKAARSAPRRGCLDRISRPERPNKPSEGGTGGKTGHSPWWVLSGF